MKNFCHALLLNVCHANEVYSNAARLGIWVQPIPSTWLPVEHSSSVRMFKRVGSSLVQDVFFSSIEILLRYITISVQDCVHWRTYNGASTKPAELYRKKTTSKWSVDCIEEHMHWSGHTFPALSFFLHFLTAQTWHPSVTIISFLPRRSWLFVFPFISSWESKHRNFTYAGSALM